MWYERAYGHLWKRSGPLCKRLWWWVNVWVASEKDLACLIQHNQRQIEEKGSRNVDQQTLQMLEEEAAPPLLRPPTCPLAPNASPNPRPEPRPFNMLEQLKYWPEAVMCWRTLYSYLGGAAAVKNALFAVKHGSASTLGCTHGARVARSSTVGLVARFIERKNKGLSQSE